MFSLFLAGGGAIVKQHDYYSRYFSGFKRASGFSASKRSLIWNAAFFARCGRDVRLMQATRCKLNMHRPFPLETSHGINHVLLAPALCLYIFFFFLRCTHRCICNIIRATPGMTRAYRFIPN